MDARRRKRLSRDPSAVGTSLRWKSKPRTVGFCGDAASERCARSRESERKESLRMGAMSRNRIEVCGRMKQGTRTEEQRRYRERCYLNKNAKSEAKGMKQDIAIEVRRALQLQQKIGKEGGEHHTFSFSHHRAISPRKLDLSGLEPGSKTTPYHLRVLPSVDNWLASRRTPGKLACVLGVLEIKEEASNHQP